ncbi:MAG: hypothetical protein ACI9JO_000666 [Psychrobacter okhotskensis]
MSKHLTTLASIRNADLLKMRVKRRDQQRIFF